MRISFLLSLSILVLGCKSYSEDDINSFNKAIDKYIEENDLKMTKTESGLYYNILEDTEQAPLIRYTDQVSFHYTGEFLDGEVFQIIPQEEALTFKVQELIVGWQEGLMQLHGVGSIVLIIPPHLGYGTKKTVKIPPNSILKYTLSVTEVK